MTKIKNRRRKSKIGRNQKFIEENGRIFNEKKISCDENQNVHKIKLKKSKKEMKKIQRKNRKFRELLFKFALGPSVLGVGESEF